MKDIGVQWTDLQKFIEDIIYTLPGIKNHKEKLTVLLTGSRAIGTYSKNSDVDIDVICTKETYNLIQKEMFDKGLTPNINQSFYYLPENDWDIYFGKDVAQPHFTITPIDIIEKQFRKYDDIPLWIWSNALIINDPNNQFEKIVSSFKSYPENILKTKVKYRYMLLSYWLIDGYPHHHSRNEEMFIASMSILNGIHELYRFFYLVEGKPYPYSEKLSLYVDRTKLGKRFRPFLDKITNLVLGHEVTEMDVWKRFDKAIELILYGDESPESNELYEACDKAMIDIGIDEKWVESGYDNIDELLHGDLGPVP